MNTNLVFSFNDMSVKDKAGKAIAKYFKRAGVSIVSHDVDTKIKRSSGIKYREMLLTFADSQTIKLRIKETGDIYQVLLNNRLTPMKNQDDHVKAVAELAQKMDAGRTKFQQKLAKAKVKLPPKVKTAAPNMIKALTEKRDALKEAIADVEAQIAEIRGGVVAA